jgi:hypothetical protein
MMTVQPSADLTTSNERNHSPRHGPVTQTPDLVSKMAP